METCPTCGETFETRRGLGVHHSSVHNERLPNRECDNCGRSFYCEYERAYCSDDCHDDAVSYDGESNPNYRGGKETAECELCENTFEYYPSEKPGLYCPTCVDEESWRHERDISGSRNPRWNGGRTAVEYDWCDSAIRRYPGRIRGEYVFCNPSCQYEWLSETFTAEGHPNWKGGSNVSYGRGWQRVRKRALERDDHECVVCEKTKEEIGRNPDVHHIVPVRAFVETPATAERDAHYLQNVVSLCIDCHRKAEFGHVSARRLRWYTRTAGV